MCTAAETKNSSKQIPKQPLPKNTEYRAYSHKKYNFNKMREIGKIFKGRRFIVDLLALAFGIGTWIGINGIFIQLPILVETAPEGWNLPSYLSVMVQIGNIGPIVYTLALHFFKLQRNKDAYIIYGLLTMGTIASLLTAFLFKKITIIFGEPHSVALFVLTVFTAINACTSSVLFMPYMGRFKEIYLITYFVGEGLSGLLPSVAALIQGVGSPAECRLVNTTETGEPVYVLYHESPRFGTQTFFIFVFVMMVISFVGFTLLHNLKIARKELARTMTTDIDSQIYVSENTEVLDVKQMDETEIKQEAGKIPILHKRLLLMLICIVSFFSNGIFNSIQSYSCLPYGPNAYHLSATLSVIANPVACFLAIFLPHTSLRSIFGLTSIATALTIYVFVTAILSPMPPLHDTLAGSVIVVIVWTLLIGFISYIKLCISTVMRAQGGRALVWTGALTQLGSLIGSLLIFFLINFTKSFTSAPPMQC